MSGFGGVCVPLPMPAHLCPHVRLMPRQIRTCHTISGNAVQCANLIRADVDMSGYALYPYATLGAGQGNGHWEAVMIKAIFKILAESGRNGQIRPFWAKAYHGWAYKGKHC